MPIGFQCYLRSFCEGLMFFKQPPNTSVGSFRLYWIIKKIISNKWPTCDAMFEKKGSLLGTKCFQAPGGKGRMEPFLVQNLEVARTPTTRIWNEYEWYHVWPLHWNFAFFTYDFICEIRYQPSNNIRLLWPKSRKSRNQDWHLAVQKRQGMEWQFSWSVSFFASRKSWRLEPGWEKISIKFHMKLQACINILQACMHIYI